MGKRGVFTRRFGSLAVLRSIATIYLFKKLTVMRTLVSILLFYCLFVGRVTAQSTASFIAISDIHLDTINTPTWEAAAKTITQIAQGKNGGCKTFLYPLSRRPPPSIRTLDHPRKSPMRRKEAGLALQGLRGIAEQANIPLLYLPGNNDSYTGDYHVFDTVLFKEDTYRRGSLACHPRQ